MELFTGMLILEVWDLTQHQFIATAQSNFLFESKQTLSKDTCIILLDFAENYTFIAQESIQAFYLNSIQPTLHPFVIYYKNYETGKQEKLNY